MVNVLELQDRPYQSQRDLGALAFENVQAEHGKEHQDNNGSYNPTSDWPNILTRSGGGTRYNLMT